MRLRAGRVVVASCLLVVFGVVTSVGAAPAQAAPTMTITPNVGLVDGQVVTVTVTGLTPLSVAGVAQCVEGHGVDGCELENRTFVSTDENGAFTTTVALHAMLATPVGAVDCRTSSDGCVLGANTDIDEIGAVWTALHFDASAALLPAPTLSTQPTDGIVDNQTVTVNGAGYPPNIGYRVQECAAGALESDCASSLFPVIAFTGASGSFTQPVQVRSGFLTGAGQFVDCRVAPGTCEIRIGTTPVTNRTGIAPLDFDPDGPLAARPTIVVDPADGLVDRQSVHATVDGFGPQAQIQIAECAPGTPQNCQPAGFGIADADGVLEIDVHVDARLWFGSDPGPDCRVEQCRLQASGYPSGDTAVVDLLFDPDAPLAPPPHLEADPDTDLVDHQVVELQGTGFDTGFGFIGTPVTGAVRAAGATSATSTPSDVVVAPGQGSTEAVMCVAGGNGFDECDYSTYQRLALSPEGEVSGPFQVDAILETFAGPVDCRTSNVGCEIRAGLVGHPYKQGVVGLSFDPDGPLAPPPTIAVTPTVDLVDGQTVEITGDGLPINRTVSVLQCLTGQSVPEGCFGSLTTGLVDESGHLHLAVPVRQILPQSFAESVDCATAANRCALVVLDQNFVAIDEEPLAFRAVAPPPTEPPPPPVTDPAPTSSTTVVEAEVLPAVETHPRFTG